MFLVCLSFVFVSTYMGFFVACAVKYNVVNDYNMYALNLENTVCYVMIYWR